MARKKSTGSTDVEVRISPSVQRDYEQRAVFPHLRLDPRFVAKGSVTYRAPRALAREVLADARLQYGRKHDVATRALKRAYLLLIRSLSAKLEPPKQELAVEAPPPAPPAPPAPPLSWLAKSRTVRVRLVRDGQLSYFDTHHEWIDRDGTFRAGFREMSRERRHEALQSIFQRCPGMQPCWYNAFRNLVAEIDDEELERYRGAAARHKASELLRRISQGGTAR